MFNFTEGVAVQTAYGHEPAFAGQEGGGELPRTLTLEATSKVRSMTLFSNFLVVETRTGASIAMPATNFKCFVMAKTEK